MASSIKNNSIQFVTLILLRLSKNLLTVIYMILLIFLDNKANSSHRKQDKSACVL